ncbi:MAG: hypothetical protein KatS3mg113_0313 [Planctomycetaceae bacterium]|nr:MAG: hypothetical protein KatS3mg113_0313 [Planctomycetaceae bacterium]
MSMSLDCRQVHKYLPLWIGHDIPDTQLVHAIQQHLKVCSQCKECCSKLRVGLDVIREVSDPGCHPTSSSIGLDQCIINTIRLRQKIRYETILARQQQWRRYHHLAFRHILSPTALAFISCCIIVSVVTLSSLRTDTDFVGSPSTERHLLAGSWIGGGTVQPTLPVRPGHIESHKYDVMNSSVGTVKFVNVDNRDYNPRWHLPSDSPITSQLIAPRHPAD